MLLSILTNKIAQRSAVLGVIGLGYVGLPVACAFAQTGFRALGVEIRPERVATINSARSPIEGNEPGLSELLAEVVGKNLLVASTDYVPLREADVVLINVETPVDDDHQPRYEALVTVCRQLGQVMKDGVLVIIESTVSPGTTDCLVRPVLEQYSRKMLNDGFYLGHCPERVMPGKLLANLRSMSRVCGGSTPETAKAMVHLYRCIVDADLDVSDCVTAELVKTAENTYRDVNIAFANELALVCEATGGDFLRVRELVNKSPGRHVLLAGAGVGGHCIPKDPWLLIHGAAGLPGLRLIPAARAVNDHMPLHIARLILQSLKDSNLPLDAAKVAVLGYAYLENSDDTRNTPTETLVGYLGKLGVQMSIHDPHVTAYNRPLEEVVKDADVLAILVRHDEYTSLDLRQLRSWMRRPVMVDARNVFNGSEAQAAGFIYRAIGQANNGKVEENAHKCTEKHW